VNRFARRQRAQAARRRIEELDRIAEFARGFLCGKSSDHMRQIVSHGVELPAIDNEQLRPISNENVDDRRLPFQERFCVSRQHRSVKVAIQDSAEQFGGSSTQGGEQIAGGLKSCGVASRPGPGGQDHANWFLAPHPAVKTQLVARMADKKRSASRWTNLFRHSAFDYRAFECRLGEQARWSAFFARTGIVPATICYKEMLSDPQSEVGKVGTICSPFLIVNSNTIKSASYTQRPRLASAA